MIEFSPLQIRTMERLVGAGFRPIAFPPYENALCVKKGECVAVLGPLHNGGFKLLAPPSYLVNGNLSVKVKRGASEVFVWKKNEVEATAERVRELAAFKSELTALLESPA